MFVLISMMIIILCTSPLISSFQNSPPKNIHVCTRNLPPLFAKRGYYSPGNAGRSSSRYTRYERSKRQERVGHLVRTEVANILHRGSPIKNVDPIDEQLRRRISIVNVDVSPDLRQARVTVSILAPKSILSPTTTTENAEYDDHDTDEENFFEDDYENNDFISYGSSAIVDKRRAYSWLVRSTKSIRYAMAHRLSHMKRIPDLTFVQADVAAAVDVMNLIDRVSHNGYKRENLGLYGGTDDSLPRGYVKEEEEEGGDEGGEFVFEEDDDYDDWVDEDEEDDFLFDDSEGICNKDIF